MFLHSSGEGPVVLGEQFLKTQRTSFWCFLKTVIVLLISVFCVCVFHNKKSLGTKRVLIFLVLLVF